MNLSLQVTDNNTGQYRNGHAIANGGSYTKCTRKQYCRILWTLQFVWSFLSNYGTTGEIALTMDSCLCTSSRTAVGRVGEALSEVEGIPDTMSHYGPLCQRHVALLTSLHDADVIDFFSFFTVVHQRGTQAIFPRFYTCHSVGRSLWGFSADDDASARLARALCEARNRKTLHAEQLGAPGYLVEAGLPMLEVMCGGWRGGESNGCSSYTEQQQQWAKLIDEYTLFLPDRSRRHELENLPQEVAIGELLESCVERLRSTKVSRDFQLECVVDVGGGNGILAAQVGERLGCDSLVIDPFYPPHSVDCCPRQWADTTSRIRPRCRKARCTRRKVALFTDTDWATDIAVDPQRTAFIAKHLCGSGIDECLAHLDAQNALPRVMVLVPCCFNKGSYDSYVNQTFLHEVLHIMDNEGYDHLTRLTDRSESSNDTAEASQHKAQRRRVKERCKQLIGCSNAIADSVEALLNCGRAQWLRSRGYDTEVLEYVPDFVTPKNKCILAVQHS